MRTILQTDGLNKVYRLGSLLHRIRIDALDDVSLVVKPGEAHCLVGENGSGKYTLIKIIAGVVTPDSGDIVINSRSFQRLHPMDAIREGIQVIYQDFSLFPNLTVAENIALNYQLSRNVRVVRWGQVHQIAQTALDKIGVRLPLDVEVEFISVADKQLVAICRALVQNARLIIMDEATTALTEKEIRALFRVIRNVQQEGVAVLFVSHKLNEVLEIADRLAVLIGGSLLQTGTPGEVFARPATDVVAEFLGAENLLEGTVTECREGAARLDIAGVEMEAICGLPRGSRVKVLIHPEEVALLSAAGEAGSVRNRLRSRVVEVKPRGALVKVGLDCGFPLVAYITRDSREDMGIEPGVEVTAAVKATAIHVMPFTGAGS